MKGPLNFELVLPMIAAFTKNSWRMCIIIVAAEAFYAA
jgi:hypothetical protein